MTDPTPLPWMVYDPEWGVEFFAMEADALAAAQHVIDSCCVDGGWIDGAGSVTVSHVTHVATEHVLGVRAEMSADDWAELTHGEGEDHDLWIEYRLTPGCPEQRTTEPADDRPPTAGEIIAHHDAGSDVEWWVPCEQAWEQITGSDLSDTVCSMIAAPASAHQPGYRLAPSAGDGS